MMDTGRSHTLKHEGDQLAVFASIWSGAGEVRQARAIADMGCRIEDFCSDPEGSPHFLT